MDFYALLKKAALQRRFYEIRAVYRILTILESVNALEKSQINAYLHEEVLFTYGNCCDHFREQLFPYTGKQ